MSPYQKYLQSPHWNKLKAEKLLVSGSFCNRCLSTDNLEVHHVYYAKSWWTCQLADLEVLCRNCHEQVHKIKFREALKQVRARARNVNALRRTSFGPVCARY